MSETAKQRNSETGKQGRNESVAGKVRTFRDLIAWQRGMVLAEAVYAATATFPDSERFGLTSQMRRAAVSIPSNIAEGHARQKRADYLKYLRTARGSLAELSTQRELAERLGLARPDPQLAELVNEEARILQALIRSLEHVEEVGR
jgi:four helix bundle protein